MTPDIKMFRTSYGLLFLSILMICGCSAIGKIENEPVSQLPKAEQRYTAINHTQLYSNGDTLLFLAFSGGGTRAAALSYGVLEELRDTHYQKNGQKIRLLDEVDRISSVSGGSFTSAYYGLFGEQIFENFKDDFLYKDIQGDLSGQLLGFFDFLGRLFSIESRTEIAIDYYDKHIFRGKTFADLQNNKGPFILINATDLNSQSQFIFTQYQFDFLCSDLSQFKIARAVAASSAVPLLFPPILIERYESCHYERPAWLIDAEKRSEQDGDARLKEDVASLEFYLNKENPPYVTLVDGGVTDNLGLRTITKSVGLSGGAKRIYERAYKNQKSPSQLVVVVVNASTHSDTEIGKSRALPSIRDTLSAVTDIQLHLYNTETNSLLKEQLVEWAQTISSKEHPITPYFIELDVTGIQNHKDRVFFNQVPTSFSIDKEQADRLIDVARRLLRENPEFQRLLLELNDS